MIATEDIPRTGTAASISSVFLRALLFSLASNAAVLSVMQFGLFLWPERLPVNTQNIFWLASGVNAAGLLILGLRYWPVLLLNAFPAWLLGFETLPMCLIGATTNTLEALLAAWIILRPGAFGGCFDGLRSVAALLVASLIAPLANTLVVPVYMCAVAAYPWADYWSALSHWNLSNGASMLILAPLILSVARQRRAPDGHVAERAAVAAVTAGLCFAAFSAVCHGTGKNYVFVVFPIVIYAAVRFGIRETSATLGIVLLSVFVSLALNAQQAPAFIWFLQAFIWVLAATGLLMAALVAERRRAELGTLEASLQAECARLAALRYQINPHFLFNALNSVRAALPISESVAREMLTDLSGYLRSTLESGETDLVPLRDEVRAVQDYLAIERRRAGDRLQAVFEISPDTEEKNVPVFLLQPLVENAIRHGLETSWERCVITISARNADSRLHIEVANTGRWREPDTQGGIGQKNIRRRLQMLYDSRADFRIRHDGGIVRIQIEIPA